MSENEFSVNEFIVREMGYPGAIKQEVVEELVRCEDCRWYQGAECVRFADVRPYPNDYCSRGERKGSEE